MRYNLFFKYQSDTIDESVYGANGLYHDQAKNSVIVDEYNRIIQQLDYPEKIIGHLTVKSNLFVGIVEAMNCTKDGRKIFITFLGDTCWLKNSEKIPYELKQFALANHIDISDDKLQEVKNSVLLAEKQLNQKKYFTAAAISLFVILLAMIFYFFF